jgi:hypothetical protein
VRVVSMRVGAFIAGLRKAGGDYRLVAWKWDQGLEVVGGLPLQSIAAEAAPAYREATHAPAARQQARSCAEKARRQLYGRGWQ